ncbi:MAG: alpha/beta hydrolase [Bacteroidales bacterium]|nr:alpha/beta hydrolase [Bacteroidales bacterium]
MMTHNGIVKIDNSNLYYKFLNLPARNPSKPILVFLHEGLGSCEQWRDFPESLSMAVNCTALVYDRLGYGQSDSRAKEISSTYMHEEAYFYLPKLLEEIGISEKLILFGHSDGGSIALLFASKFPEKAAGIITECDHVFCEQITVDGVKKISTLFREGKLRKLLLMYHGSKIDLLFQEWSGFWLSEEAKNWNIENILTNITAPILAIQGKNDTYGTVLQLESKLKKINSDIQILYLSNCAHVPHFEQKQKVFDTATNFIKELPDM